VPECGILTGGLTEERRQYRYKRGVCAELTSRGSTRRLSVMLYFAGVLSYFFCHFQRAAVPGTVFDELQASTGMSAAAISAFGAVFMYVYAVSQFCAGLFADKYGGVRSLLFGSVLFCAGVLFFPLVPAGIPGGMYVSRALAGAGAGVLYIALFKETDRLFAGSFTLMLGTTAFLGSCGGVCAGLPLAALCGRFGWRGALLLAAVPQTAVCLTLICLARRAAPVPVLPVKIDLKPYGKVLREPMTWKLFGCYVPAFGVYMVLLAVTAKKFMQDFSGWSSGGAALAPTLMVAAATACSFASGALCRFVRRLTAVYRCSVASVLIGTLIFCFGIVLRLPGWCFVAAMILTAAAAGFSPVLGALVRETSDPRFSGTCLSFLSGASFVVAAAGANAAGVLMELFAGSGRRIAASAEGAEAVVIYPPSSYLAVGVMLAVAAGIACWSSLSLPRTGSGGNIYPALARGRTLGRHLPRRGRCG